MILETASFFDAVVGSCLRDESYSVHSDSSPPIPQMCGRSPAGLLDLSCANQEFGQIQQHNDPAMACHTVKHSQSGMVPIHAVCNAAG